MVKRERALRRTDIVASLWLAFARRNQGNKVPSLPDCDRPDGILTCVESTAPIGKGTYRHFMMKEIAEQPTAIGDTLQSLINPLTRRIELPLLPIDLGCRAAIRIEFSANRLSAHPANCNASKRAAGR